MKRNDRMIDNGLNKLEVVQKRSRVREFFKDDLLEIIESAQNQVRQEMNKWSKKYLKHVKFETFYTLPNSYNYRGETTYISGKINKYGNIINLHITRDFAPKQPYGGLVEIIEPIFE
jgi:hypothetical protein